MRTTKGKEGELPWVYTRRKGGRSRSQETRSTAAQAGWLAARGEARCTARGRYVGTITGDRLVYRSTDSAAVSSPFSAASRAGSAQANRAGSAIWGDEPSIPD